MEDTASATHDSRCTSNSRAAHSLHRCSAEWAHVFFQALESRQSRKEFQKDLLFCAVGWGPHFPKQSFSYFLQKHHMWYLQVMGNRTHFCSTCHPLLDAAKQRNQCDLGSPFSRFENEVFLRQALQHSVHLWINKPFVRPSNDCHHQAWQAKLWLDANEL